MCGQASERKVLVSYKMRFESGQSKCYCPLKRIIRRFLVSYNRSDEHIYQSRQPGKIRDSTRGDTPSGVFGRLFPFQRCPAEYFFGSVTHQVPPEWGALPFHLHSCLLSVQGCSLGALGNHHYRFFDGSHFFIGFLSVTTKRSNFPSVLDACYWSVLAHHCATPTVLQGYRWTFCFPIP